MNTHSPIAAACNTGHFGRLVRNTFLFAIILVVQLKAAQVSLSWTDNSTDEIGFRIERASGGGDFLLVGTVAQDTTTWADPNTEAGGSYTYRVAAYNDAGVSAFSNSVSITQGTSTISISLQPTNTAAIPAGTNASFMVAASGTPSPQFQWQVSSNNGANWTNLAEAAPYGGTNTNTLAIASVLTSFDKNQYRAVLTNGISTVYSNAGILSIAPTPPRNVSVKRTETPPN